MSFSPAGAPETSFASRVHNPTNRSWWMLHIQPTNTLITKLANPTDCWGGIRLLGQGLDTTNLLAW
jgi:hypothetical protein